jgi:hypothetical protein
MTRPYYVSAMLRTALLTTCTLLVATACPDRERAIDTVGGAPGRQVEDARVRIDRAEGKLKENAAAAAAAEGP